MLDADTKRRIDNARDILVGKVPDPKSQVEQITIALIYKFMDDMDAENEEWGGEREFFADGFEQHRWANLVRSGLGGHEMLNRYADALARMPQNPAIPPLFRSIFSNAYLPYRDPETLRLFLKEIDGFRYEQSDGFGDAYEYLLRVLGAQGDAGQFLTPRHIIEFIVRAVVPRKDERVLDPACGTAGFLIAAYKHILAANAGGDGQSSLTPDESKRLANNFTGYDISPDMARLSRVNMYLHGFAAPNIQEYDTLTSEEFWTQYADVILANPPFMSPKGGIRPHDRFGVQSKRSEVLFVDYIAEHLTASGRAGVIVPEGIIFQGQTAHTQLRKMLVEKRLAAVVSLPAGVFQPYSGVKTSILILDNALARRTDSIAFFKVESDGFDLGAQRRPIERNDLPAVQAELAEYLRLARAGEPLDGFAPARGLIVEKTRIAAGGDYNLSMERYREDKASGTEWPITPLGELVELVRGVTYTKNDEVTENGHSVLRANNIDAYTGSLDLSDIKQVSATLEFEGSKKLRADDIFICLASGSKTHIGKVAFIQEGTNYYFGGFMGAVRGDQSKCNPKYLFQMLRESRFNDFLRRQIIGANINNLSGKILYRYAIPLPSMETQAAIVEEIEGYQRVLDGARAVVEGWRPRIVVDPEWPVVRVDEVAAVRMGETLIKGDMTGFGKPVFSADSSDEPWAYTESTRLSFGKNTVVIGARGTIGSVKLPNIDEFTCTQTTIAATADAEKINPAFLYPLLMQFDFKTITEGVGIPMITVANVNKISVPLPPMDAQRAIVKELEAERSLVDANRELMERMASRIAGAVGRVWGGAG